MNRSQEILDDLKQRHPHAYTLAVRLALAVRIDPAYLRAIRLHFVPQADTDDELALWTSALVRSKGYDGFVFTHEVNELLRAELENDPALWKKVWDMTERLHRGEPPSLVAEERIRYAAMRVPYEGPDRLDDEIRKVLAWPSQGEADKLNRFGAYLLPTLPKVAARSLEAWRLQDIVKDYPGFRGGLKGKADARLYKEGLGLDINRLKKRPLFVRHVGTSLTFSTEPLDALAIEVPDTNPIELELRWDEPTYHDEEARYDGSIDYSGQRHRKERLVLQESRQGTEIQVGEGKVHVKTLAGDEFEFQTPFSRLVEEVQQALRFLGEYEGPVNGWLKSLVNHWGDELPVAAVDTAALEQYLATLRPKPLGVRGIKVFVDFSQKSVDVLAAWLRPLFAYYHVEWNDPVKGFKPGINLESSLRQDLADIDLYLMVLEKDTPQTVMRRVHEAVSSDQVKTKLISILYGDAKVEGSGLESREMIPPSGPPLASMAVADGERVLQMALGSILKELHDQAYSDLDWKRIYIIYKSEPVSNALVTGLDTFINSAFPNLQVIFEENSMKSFGDIREYIARVAEQDRIIVLIGQNFLESQFCMYELVLAVEKIKNRGWIFPIFLPGTFLDHGRILFEVDRWTTNWEQQRDTIAGLLKRNPKVVSVELRDRLEVLEQIAIGCSSALDLTVRFKWRELDNEGQLDMQRLQLDLLGWIKLRGKNKIISNGDKLHNSPREASASHVPALSLQIKRLIGDMVFIEGGSFWMGAMSDDKEAHSDEKPQHEVRLQNYHIGKYPVTQAQWEAVMGGNPSHFKSCPDCPVEWVSWNDCQEFLQKLNALTGLAFGLPTEAQWEYAARGGQPGMKQRHKYAGGIELDKVGWHIGNSQGRTHSVGKKEPNALGLFDMSGNVWEWCSNRYEAKNYQHNVKVDFDPLGPSHGDSYVLRGGSWADYPKACRVTFRHSAPVGNRGYNGGLRLKLD